MQYKFLNHFPKRMKNVGLYVVLLQNSMQKTTWQKYGFAKNDEQINLIFAVLLYIMEQSLKEETCTRDDIAVFIDNINMQCFGKEMSYENCKNLGDFILNVILSNEGKAMYFDGFNFEQRAYQIMNISYIANRIIYVEDEVKRTSYYLTDDGYNLLLGTLEMENNMKLNIHEMIFKMHLEKQSYDKAADEIKNVFNLLRIQIQKIQEAMNKVRRNALNYSVVEYEKILDENLNTISDTKKKFQNYREVVTSRVKELEEEKINIRKLSSEEEEKLVNLGTIEQYLSRSIDEHQRILNGHFDLKTLYTKELEQLSKVSFIKRFSFRSDFYDKVLENSECLERMDLFLRPLFTREPDKIYNLNKALEIQKPIRQNREKDETETIDLDEEAWQKEQEKRLREKLKKYETCLSFLLNVTLKRGEITLNEISRNLTESEKICLFPNIQIFKEIMVELIKNQRIDILALKKEKSEYIQEKSDQFQLNEMLLSLVERQSIPIQRVEVFQLKGKIIKFYGVQSEDGSEKCVCCSNVLFRVIQEGEV